MEGYDFLWKNALKELEITVSNLSFATYIQILEPVDIKGNTIVLCTSNEFFGKYIGENSPLETKIKDALRKTESGVTDFELFFGTKEEYVRKSQESWNEEIPSTPINKDFTFESFVVGDSNEFLYAAARAVAEDPGSAYNPLFIYGGTGLGKTHILMAIANYLRLHSPSLKVIYTTCEQFTNQFIESIRRGKGNSLSTNFRNRYRNVDVLLIDDVQFLAGKEGIQTEFFHTFNELVMQNKQVVLTSDRPPKEIETLEDRLRTRFEGGLLADVQPPDVETRIAILKRKAEERKCILNSKVLAFLAESSEPDVRTLIARLTKVIFASKLHEREITVEFAAEALKEATPSVQEEVKIDDIIKSVCSFFKINKNDLLSKKKNKEFTEPRQICMYLITELMSLPLVTIGQKMGGKDHATVIYARDKIAELVEEGGKVAVMVNDIKNMILKK
ncbi:MAG: chromosomal replication initiator protein DnaA [Clostridia bacterium]|nr:chromosomal replication initiator protein DnaA [Clostridia bacterium]